MAFLATIDNNTVASLPAARFDGKIVIIDKEELVEAACNDLKQYTILGFDTETRPSFRAGVSYKVSLLQLSTPKTCYLFRLSHIRLDNKILNILGSHSILKVGVDVSGDIRSLHALRNFKADGFVDLQNEAIRWGIQEKSLRKLSAIVLGMRVSKAQRLSNWEAEQLTAQQQEYAATDAWVATRILETLEHNMPLKEPLKIIACLAPQGNDDKTHSKPERHRRRSHRPRRESDNQASTKTQNIE